jgi:hypothetical protein
VIEMIMGELLDGLLKNVGAVLTILIAIVTVWIAYQQSQTAKAQQKVAQDKLKLDLFDRRYKVYQGVMDFIQALNMGNTDPETFGQLYEALGPACFLFESEVVEYIGLVRKHATEMRDAHRVQKRAGAHKWDDGGPTAEELSEACEKERESVGWFYEQPEKASRVFQRYLDFKRL